MHLKTLVSELNGIDATVVQNENNCSYEDSFEVLIFKNSPILWNNFGK